MAGIDGYGVALERSNGDGWERVAEATNVSGPGIEREVYDVTTHDSPGQWEENIFGIKRPGEISVDVNYHPEMHDRFLEDFDTPNPVDYRITWPDGSEWEFQAGLVGFEPEAPHDEHMTAALTFQLSGQPEFSTLES